MRFFSVFYPHPLPHMLGILCIDPANKESVLAAILIRSACCYRNKKPVFLPYFSLWREIFICICMSELVTNKK
jgi:hypothetical protein